MSTKLQKGDFVHFTFDKENGLSNEHKGEVLEIDEDPHGPNTFFARISDGDNNTEIHYYEGEMDGEEYSAISRHSEFSGDTTLGTNVDYEVFG